MNRVLINVKKKVEVEYVKAGDIVILPNVDLVGDIFMVVLKNNGKYNLLNMETGVLSLSTGEYTQREITQVCKNMTFEDEKLVEKVNLFRKNKTKIIIDELLEESELGK